MLKSSFVGLGKDLPAPPTLMQHFPFILRILETGDKALLTEYIHLNGETV